MNLKHEKYSDQITVSAIVVNYNGKDYLEGCLSSLEIQNFPGTLEIIVVDNGSNDGSQEFVERTFPHVILIKNNNNVGHAEACNQGARVSKGEYLFFIDNDTVLEQGCIHELLNVFNIREKVGVVGCMIKDYASNRIQEFGVAVDKFSYPLNCVAYGEEDNNQFSGIRQVFYTSSCAMLIEKDVFNFVGLFDIDYFVYKDDLDLCWRINLIGYKVFVTPKARLYHKMGVVLGGTSPKKGERYQTTLQKRYFGERNTLLTLLKNYSFATLFRILPIFFLMMMPEILVQFDDNKFIINAYGNALYWNIRNLPKTLQKRKNVQTMRIITDKEIQNSMTRGIAKLRVLQQIGMPKVRN